MSYPDDDAMEQALGWQDPKYAQQLVASLTDGMHDYYFERIAAMQEEQEEVRLKVVQRMKDHVWSLIREEKIQEAYQQALSIPDRESRDAVLCFVCNYVLSELIENLKTGYSLCHSYKTEENITELLIQQKRVIVVLKHACPPELSIRLEDDQLVKTISTASEIIHLTITHLRHLIDEACKSVS